MPVQNLLNRVMNRGARGHALPEGQRVYAVGDIHGRLDLLEALMASIQADDGDRGPARTTIIFLGDLVDRGPDSRGVVDRAIELSRGPLATRFLMGNHEEVFLRAVKGDVRALRLLLRIGGKETVQSYGISPEDYRSLDFADLLEQFRARVPAEHVKFLSSFEEAIEIGDYLFVHAGIRPGVSLEDQSGADLRWIRDDFLRDRSSHGWLVVHGHSISEDVDVRSNRIGIDTGAYATGCLTAIGLEGDGRWFLST